MRGSRLLVALLAALAVAALAPAAASAARSADAEDAARRSTECAGPCPLAIVKKGNGSGTITSSPPGVDCGLTCYVEVEETSTVVLIATAASLSQFGGWQSCPAPRNDGTCEIAAGGGGVVCAVFVDAVSPSPGPLECPPPSGAPPPPPPPPTKPPPLGSPCTIRGSNASEIVKGTPGNDVICALGGNDTIYGKGGHDLLVGGNGNDRLYGESGNDRLVGGPGRDVLNGGVGGDMFHVRDSVRDVASGGFGSDRARADRIDTLRSIERRF